MSCAHSWIILESSGFSQACRPRPMPEKSADKHRLLTTQFQSINPPLSRNLMHTHTLKHTTTCTTLSTADTEPPEGSKWLCLSHTHISETSSLGLIILFRVQKRRSTQHSNTQTKVLASFPCSLSLFHSLSVFWQGPLLQIKHRSPIDAGLTAPATCQHY